MLDATQSGCINHPGVEATVRCKQCGRPVCDACVATGPTGRFCSEACRSKHEAFMQQAQQLEGKGRGSTLVQLKKLAGSLVVIAVVLIVIGVVASLYPVPVLSDIVFKVRGMLGL